jgi:hypothetical protein
MNAVRRLIQMAPNKGRDDLRKPSSQLIEAYILDLGIA